MQHYCLKKCHEATGSPGQASRIYTTHGNSKAFLLFLEKPRASAISKKENGKASTTHHPCIPINDSHGIVRSTAIESTNANLEAKLTTIYLFSLKHWRRCFPQKTVEELLLILLFYYYQIYCQMIPLPNLLHSFILVLVPLIHFIRKKKHFLKFPMTNNIIPSLQILAP